MIILRRTLRFLSVGLVSLAAWSAMAVPAWAQAGPRQRYVGEYLVIILLVGLGVFAVMRSVGRSKDIKPRQDD